MRRYLLFLFLLPYLLMSNCARHDDLPPKITINDKQILIAIAKDKRDEVESFNKIKGKFYELWEQQYSARWKNTKNFKEIDLDCTLSNQYFRINNTSEERLTLINIFLMFGNNPTIYHYDFGEDLVICTSSEYFNSGENNSFSNLTYACVVQLDLLESNSGEVFLGPYDKSSFYRVVAFSLNGGVFHESKQITQDIFSHNDKTYRIEYTENGGEIYLMVPNREDELVAEFMD